MSRAVIVLALVVLGACRGSSVAKDGEIRSGDEPTVTTSTAASGSITTTNAPCPGGASECTVIVPYSAAGADVCGVLGPDGCLHATVSGCTPVSYTKTEHGEIDLSTTPTTLAIWDCRGIG